jgi:hypothetical protein
MFQWAAWGARPRQARDRIEAVTILAMFGGFCQYADINKGVGNIHVRFLAR